MSDQLKEFESPALHVKMANLPDCRVAMDIAVFPAAVARAYQHALKAVNKDISIPGFRKGHIPQGMLEKRFAKDIWNSWNKTVVNESLNEAFKITGYHPHRTEAIFDLQLLSLDRAKGASLRLQFEHAPIMPPITLDGLHLHKLPFPTVNDMQVDMTLQTLRIQKSSLQQATEERPAREGDVLLLHIELHRDDMSNQLLENRLWEATPERMPDWIYRTVIGMKVGEKAEVQCESDGLIIVAVQEGSSLPMAEITVREIREGKLVPLDEALSKQFGCPDVAALREGAFRELDRLQSQHILDDLISQVEHYLTTTYTFDVPRSMFEKAVESIVNRKRAEKASTGMTPDEEAALRQQIEELMKASLRRYFITERIVRDHKLTVSHGEVIYETMREEMMGLKRADEDEQKRAGRIYSHLLQRKAMEKLASMAEANTEPLASS